MAPARGGGRGSPVAAGLPCEDVAACGPGHLHEHGVLQVLLQSGANPNVATPDGVAALHLAVFSGDLNAVELLLASRADPNAQDRAGQTPLFFAPTGPICEALVRAGAAVDKTNAQRQSALHLAAHAGLSDVLEWLVARVPAQLLNATDLCNCTPADYAVWSRSKATVRLLRSRGARPTRTAGAGHKFAATPRSGAGPTPPPSGAPSGRPLRAGRAVKPAQQPPAWGAPQAPAQPLASRERCAAPDAEDTGSAGGHHHTGSPPCAVSSTAPPPAAADDIGGSLVVGSEAPAPQAPCERAIEPVRETSPARLAEARQWLSRMFATGVEASELGSLLDTMGQEARLLASAQGGAGGAPSVGANVATRELADGQARCRSLEASRPQEGMPCAGSPDIETVDGADEEQWAEAANVGFLAGLSKDPALRRAKFDLDKARGKLEALKSRKQLDQVRQQEMEPDSEQEWRRGSGRESSRGDEPASQLVTLPEPMPHKTTTWEVTLDGVSAPDEQLGSALRALRGAPLVIRSIAPNGSLSRWNQKHPEAAVQMGDYIVEVLCSTQPEASPSPWAAASPATGALRFRVARPMQVFEVRLEKDGGNIGINFKLPLAEHQRRELRIIEVLPNGALSRHNTAHAAAGSWELVVLPEMRIAAVNGIQGDIKAMVRALSESPAVLLRVRRANADGVRMPSPTASD